MNLTADFLISEVLNIKPGGIRIGLDISVGTGNCSLNERFQCYSTTINLRAAFE